LPPRASAAARHGACSGLPAMSPRLLVVDDEDSILVGLRRFFDACGFHTDCASEREEAAALLDCLDSYGF
jgi:hypothetical protein